MADNPSHVGYDGGRVSHGDYHVGIGHRGDQHFAALELKGVLDVEHNMDLARPHAGTGRDSRKDRNGGRYSDSPSLSRACRGDGPRLDEVDGIVVNEPLNVLR